MKSAIISVGTELLFGQIVNTNAAYLSQELNEMGVDVLYHYTMGDNPGRLKRVLEFAMEDCDLFLVTGGLGPTEDDLTKETICDLLDEKLVLHEPTKKMIDDYFERVWYKKTENNYKQAYVPENAVVFQNHNGTAPGFVLEKEGKLFICMPGVPREMKRMFQDAVKPYLMKLADAYIVSRSLRVFGVGESRVETMLLEFIDGQTDPTIATYAKESEVEIRITSKRRRKKEAIAAVDEMAENVARILGDSVFTMDGEELYRVTANKMKEKGVSLSLCETVTGGEIAAMLSRYPEYADILDQSVVLPGEDAQIRELSISREILDEYTIFSPEAVEALTESIYRKTGSDICLSVTGNAGPDYCDGVEPGTFCLCLLYDGKMTTRLYTKGFRERNLAIEFMARCALNAIRLILDGKLPSDKL